MNRKLKIMANLLLTAAFAAVSASCSKDEPESPQAITVQDNASLTQEVFADRTQGESNVTFTTTGAWTSLITEKTSSVKATGPHPKPLEADASIAWISISPDHGDRAGDYTVAVTLTPNLTGADRAAVITITCKGTEVAVTVTQKAENEDGTVVQLIDSGVTGKCTWTLTGAPGNYTLTISGNGAMEDYEWDGSPWLQYRDDIKTAVIQDGVTIIGECAFQDYSSLTAVTIPNSVQTIGEASFYGCSSLTAVTIPNSVQTISDFAFGYCNGLISVTIGNSVQTIGLFAFTSCRGLTAVTIPNSVITISASAFSFCTGLTDATIGSSVQTIGREAFVNCSSLTAVTIPNSVTTIGDRAFRGSGLTAVTIPNSVQTIDEWAFSYCSSLTDIYVEAANTQYSSENGILFNKDKTTLVCYPEGKPENSYVIPNSVITIGASAFAGCDGLTAVTIPNSVQTIGESAFADCAGLTAVTIPNSAQTIGKRAFMNCDGLTAVTIPNSVTTIGDGAFYGCTGLTAVTIPNSVQTIGEMSFFVCTGLTDVTIGNSVQTIDFWAFYGCTGLTVVTNLNPVPQNINSNVFDGVNISALTLKVPAGAVNDYKAAPVWDGFGNIMDNE